MANQRLTLFIAMTLIAPGCAAPAAAATPAELETARSGAIAGLIRNQDGDGSWASPTGDRVLATTAGVEAFGQAGLADGAPHTLALAWLENAHPVTTQEHAARCARWAARSGGASRGMRAAAWPPP